MNSTQSTLSGKSKYLLSLAILGVASGLCVILVLFKEPPPNREDANLTPTVSVFPASVFDGRLSIEVSGVVEPHREVTVSAQVSGEISEKSPDAVAGNFVRQGDLLMAIDPQDYELEIDRLNAELEQSKAAINELNDELEGLERSREIVQRDYNLQLQELERRRMRQIGAVAERAGSGGPQRDGGRTDPDGTAKQHPPGHYPPRSIDQRNYLVGIHAEQGPVKPAANRHPGAI